MQLHLDKSHGFVAKEFKILRVESLQGEFVAEWVAVTADSKKRILMEHDIEMDRRHDFVGQSEKASLTHDTGTESARWSASAMQNLYRNREGLNTAL